MSFWNIFGQIAVSQDGTTIQKLSDTFSVSSDGVTYTTMGNFTTGSDGSTFTKMGAFSSDGSTRMGRWGLDWARSSVEIPTMTSNVTCQSGLLARVHGVS